MSTKSRLAVISAAAVGAVSLTGSSPAGADLDSYFWSQTGGQLAWGSSSNIVGFWQALGYEKHPCPGSYYDGIYGSKTVAMTKRMQNDIANVPATGVVDSTTWGNTQAAIGPFGFRLTRDSGTSGNSGFFHYYNGGSTNAPLYWQGLPSSNPGTGIWKFTPGPSNTNYIYATSSRTMGSYSAC